MADKIFSDHRAIKQHTLGRLEPGTAGPAPPGRAAERQGGDPIYSHPMTPPRNETNPAFSAPIAPGPDEGKPLRDGPAWKEGLRNRTPVQHSPNKQDGKNIGRRKPITY